jgi:hypothetical protein
MEWRSDGMMECWNDGVMRQKRILHCVALNGVAFMEWRSDGMLE